jgi:hypothetical protein
LNLFNFQFVNHYFMNKAKFSFATVDVFSHTKTRWNTCVLLPCILMQKNQIKWFDRSEVINFVLWKIIIEMKKKKCLEILKNFNSAAIYIWLDCEIFQNGGQVCYEAVLKWTKSLWWHINSDWFSVRHAERYFPTHWHNNSHFLDLH